MSKSVLVIKTPENCRQCKYTCMMRQEAEERPKECPLRPLPQKEVCNEYKFEGFTNGVAYGWNRCLDMITGKQEKMH